MGTDHAAPHWLAFLDDASPLGDGPVQPHPSSYVDLRVVRETDLPRLLGHPADLRVSLAGGAAQLAGPASYCRRNGLSLAAIDTTLRDLDDPAGNARRVVAALDDALAAGHLGDDVRLHVGVAGQPTAGWLAAADLLAEVEAVLMVPLDADPTPWIDAALDRELEISFVGGTVEDAVAALRTTARLWNGAEPSGPDDLLRARRFVLGWVTTDVDAAIAHLDALG